MEIGNVSRLDLRNRVGLIEPEDGPHLPFDLSEYRGSRPIRVGEAVMFDCSYARGRKVAARIQSLG